MPSFLSRTSRSIILSAALLPSLAACAGDEPPAREASFVQDSELAFPGRAGVLEEGRLLLPEPIDIDYERIDGLRVFEGDILLDDAIVEPTGHASPPGTGAAQQALAVSSDPNRRWNGGIVPYEIASGLASKQDALDAMAHIEAETSLQFVPRSNESDYVRFVAGAGCSSYIGRIGGSQNITLNQACGFGGAVHEVLHAIGAWHEQQRLDRDDSVKIRYQNVQEGYESNFDKYLSGSATAMTSYDIGSIMHYGSFAFSKNGQPTIVRASNNATFEPNRDSLTAADISGVQLLYGNISCNCSSQKVCNASDQCVYFFDVPTNHTHAKNIDKLFEAGITKGCGEHLYCPSASVTREQMATFLTRALGLSPKSGNHFVDVPSGSTHEKSIYAIYEAGITKGCGSNTFCPKHAVTRAQMASFLVRALGLTPTSGNYFTDIAGNVHEKSINALYVAGITKGCGGSKYCPHADVTRAQMASFLVRAFNL